MKQIFLLLFAWTVATATYGQSQDSTEAVLGKMQDVVTNALPSDPVKAHELLPILVALSNQVNGLRATTDDAIRLSRQYAEQIKPKAQDTGEVDPANVQAYRKIYQELMGRLEQSSRTKKQLDAIAGQIAARIEVLQKSQSSSPQVDKQ